MNSFRIDRLLTLYFFYRFKLFRPQRKELEVPILMYHSISESGENYFYPYFQTNTSPKVFDEHMRFLYENNYSVIRLQDISEYFIDEKGGDYKPIILTFDDGYADFYTEALEILSQYDFGVTAFLPTGFIGENRMRIDGKERLCWREVRECQAEGVDFGSHTISHSQLSGLKKRYIVHEVKSSKETIQDKSGVAVKSFSYPYAFPEDQSDFTRYLSRLLKNCGYLNGVTTIIGTATKRDNRYFMKRIPVNSYDDLRLFRAKIEGGCNWIHSVQYLKKKLKITFHVQTDKAS